MPIFAVTTARAVNWDHSRGIRDQPFWQQHAAYADELAGRGVIVFGGPVSGGSDEDIALMAVEAADEGALRAIFDADPWTIHRVFRVKEVRSWTIWLDSRPLPPPAP